jgi:hypothetical protein
MLGMRSGGYFRLLAFALVVTTFFPLLYQNLPPIIHSYHLYAALWLASILILYSDLLLNRPIRYLLIYALITLGVFYFTFWGRVDHWDWAQVRIETYYIITASTVLAYFMTSEDFSGFAALVKWALVFVGITAVMSIYASFKDPTYARSITAGELSQGQLTYFQKLGAGTYSFGEALVCLFPMMVYLYKHNERGIFSRKVILIYGVLCFYALLRMQIFANILFAILLIAVSLLGTTTRKASIFVIVFLFAALYFIPTSLYSEAAVQISNYFNPTSVVYFKLRDLSKYLIEGQYVQTAIGGREARYPLLIAGFVQSPILGFYYDKIGTLDISPGGHLYWMNKLAVFGIVGFLLYLKIHANHLRQTVKSQDEEFSFYFLVATLGGLGLGLAKNIVGREFWFTYFVILPGIQYLTSLRRNESSE